MSIARDSLALFRKRDFTFLMGAQWLAQAADGLVGLALAKKITFGGSAGFDLDVEGAATPREALLIVLLTFLPYMIISPFMGVFIDRWNRRMLLILANGVRAVLLLTVGILGPDAIGNVALYGSFLLVLGGTRLVLAIKGAGLPAALGGEDELMQGNATSQAGSAIFQLGGAGVALVAAGFVDARLIILAGALVYGAATASASLVHRLGEARAVVPLRKEIGRVFRDLLDGFREIGRRPMAGLAIVSFLSVRTLLTLVVLATVFISRDLIASQDTLTTAIPAAAGALGAVVGFVIAHALKDRVRPARIVSGALLFGAAGMLAFGGVINMLGISALAFCVGVAFFLGKVAVDTLMQQALADSYRGRGFSLQDVSYNLSWVLPALLLWLVLTPDTARMVLIGSGAAFLLIALLIGLWSRALGGRPERKIEAEEVSPPASRTSPPRPPP
ncbi:MAG TPA: MFS transporter [Actinomycetota bacterium]